MTWEPLKGLKGHKRYIAIGILAGVGLAFLAGALFL